MDFALWSTPAVRQHLVQALGIELSIRAVGNYLARWGFTPQKPVKKAYEQRPEPVKAWPNEQYPAIEAKAKAGGAEIHWGDETALVNTDVRGRSYAPMGKTPVTCAVGGTRYKLSMIATVTNQGKTRWMIIDESHDLSFSSDKADRVSPGVDSRCPAQRVSDLGQLEGSSQQARQRLGA